MRSLVLTVALLAGAEASAAVVVEMATQPWLQVGADGLGVVAYRHQEFGAAGPFLPGELRVSHCVDAACSAVTTSVVDASGNVGYRASMAIAPDGRPVVSYLDRVDHSLKVAFCGDAACTTSSIVVLDGDVEASQNIEGGRTAIAVGADGRVLVAYTDLEPGAPPPPLLFNDRLKIVHCDDATCTTRTTTDVADAVGNHPVALGVGGDGRGFVMWHRIVGGTALLLARGHCSDAACTSVPFIMDPPGPVFSGMPSLAFQANGLPAYLYSDRPFVDTGGTLRFVRCQDAACSSIAVQTIDGVSGPSTLSLPDGAFPRFVGNVPTTFGTQLALFQCLDAACATREVSCVAGQRFGPSLVTDGGGQPLLAFERSNQPHLEIRRLALPGPAACAPETWVEDGGGAEGTPPGAFSAQFIVRTAPPADAPIVVTYQTVDGSAQAGSDYVAQSGTVTMETGSAFLIVPIVADSVPEPDEIFSLQLTAVAGAALVDGRGLWVINNDDGPLPPLPIVGVTGCTVVEGHAGTTDCMFQVALSASTPQTVTVQFATQNGTATAGVDYLAQAGALTFAPGTQTQTVSVSVIGDVVPEPHERFALVLSNPQNALPGTLSADGLVVDEDVLSASRVEASHGARLLGDLAEGPDLYRLAQPPFSSWEAVIDGASGDVVPELLLERLAEDGSTVLQTAVATGTGSALGLRWQHRGAVPELRQQLRVRSTACGTACGPDDTYRLRVYETTGRIPRFNASIQQTTVVLLQNMGDTPASITLDFWSATGALLLSHPAALGPFQLLVLDTAALPEVASASGTITVTHDAAYGSIVGKSAAVVPATGFTFDSPLEPRPR